MNAEFFVETLQPNKIIGWGWVPESPETKLDVSVLVNGEFVGRLRCSLFREELQDSGKGDGSYGMEFDFETPIDINRDEVVIESQQFGEVYRHTPKPTKKSARSKANKANKVAAAQDIAPVTLVIQKEGEGDEHEIAAEESAPPGEQNEVAVVDEGEDSVAETSEDESRKVLVSAVEPFLDMNFAAMRSNLIDEAVVAQKRIQLLAELGDLSGHDLTNKLIDVLANLKAEVQYLKAAYLEESRYKEPEFKIKTPGIPKRIKPDVLEVDFRGEITGGNWYHAEPDGRWAGPENYSSVLVPSLNHGAFDVFIHVVGEIEPGIIQGTQLNINGEDVEFENKDISLPGTLKARFTVDEGYRFPFWALKLRFPRLVSPTKFGVPDKRMLAIRVQSIRFAKVVDA